MCRSKKTQKSTVHVQYAVDLQEPDFPGQAPHSSDDEYAFMLRSSHTKQILINQPNNDAFIDTCASVDVMGRSTFDSILTQRFR